MPSVELAYLWEPRINGKTYTYYRRNGLRTPLPRRDTPEFLLAYYTAHEAAEAAQRNTPSAPGVLAGSMAALIGAYRASPEWRGLAPASRKDYDKALTPLAERFGRLMVADMPRQFVFKLRDEYSTMPAFTRHKTPRPIKDANGKQVMLDTPRRANRMVDVLRLLLAWAENRGGWIKKNVALRPGRLETGPGYLAWTQAHVDALMKSAPEPIRRAAMLGICTGQRKGDCLSMLRTARANGELTVVQAKTRARLVIPEHPDLTAALDAAPPSNAPTLLTRADGKPWGEDHFAHVFAKAVKDAGLPPLTFHGLRKTASGWLAESGATDAEIDAILGHVDPRMTAHYRRQADQKIRAGAAMGKLALRRIGHVPAAEPSAEP